MCIASERLQEIKSYTKTLEKDRTKLRNTLTELDKEMNRMYHIIENTHFDASRGYCLAKQLQDVLHKRRKIKDEIDTLNSLITNLNNGLDQATTRVGKVKEKIRAKRLACRHYKIAFA